MIDLRFRLRKIAIAATVNDVNVLTSVGVIKAEMMLLQGGGIGSVAGTVEDDGCKHEEDRRKQESGDSLQEAKPPSERSSDEKKELARHQQFTGKNGERRNWRLGIIGH